MAQYGQILDVYDPNTEEMYKAFANYFNNPKMVKIKDVNKYSMYMCKTYCLLSNECRYIIVFVQEDFMPTQSQEYLEALKWESLQTRTLPDRHQLSSHGYQPKRMGLLNVGITRKEIKPECSIYTCEELPITVTLLHEKNGPNDYKQKGNVISALETYNTIITINSKIDKS